MNEDEDWDAEGFVPAAPVISREPLKSNWDDEEEEEDVKESWEDEDTPKPVVGPAAAPEPVQQTAVTAATVAQKAKVGGKHTSERKEKKTVEKDDPATKLAEKLRQQRLVEEADYQSTTELFGKNTGDRTLETFIPKSESDFLEYAELVAHKLRPFEKSFHYLTLLKAVIRHSMTSLKAADAKEIASAVQVISNEKLKIEKEATAGKKKTGSKKKQLHIEADEEEFAQTYDNVDDYDFM